jgi:NAD(P)-dependent dehydrogenase (short-subunit alcohol dehydrogenase family)
MPTLRHDHPLGATFMGILDRVRVRRALPRLGPDERIDGKVALVTGASSGLGFATAVDLARRGARVVMADRQDLEGARRRAEERAGRAAFESLAVDLADLEAVHRACSELEARGAKLDVVVLNAAIVPTEARRTPQGLDEMFVVNYLASFALVTELLRRGLVDPSARPRIVFVSSEGHRWSVDRPFDELAERRDPALARVLAYYGEYKMLLTTFACELGRRLAPDGAHVSALCPGAMNTNIVRDAPPVVRTLVKGAMRVFFQDPFAADEPVVYLAVSRAMEGRTGVYLHKMRPKDPDPRAMDPARGRALWEASEALLRASRKG